MFITINSKHKLGDKLEVILSKAKSEDWQEVMREICNLMAEQLKTTDRDVLRISLYCDMLAMSDPERVKRIAERIGEDNQSPLLEVVTAMYFQEVMLQMNLAENMILAKCFRVWQSIILMMDFVLIEEKHNLNKCNLE